MCACPASRCPPTVQERVNRTGLRGTGAVTLDRAGLRGTPVISRGVVQVMTGKKTNHKASTELVSHAYVKPTDMPVSDYALRSVPCAFDQRHGDEWRAAISGGIPTTTRNTSLQP